VPEAPTPAQVQSTLIGCDDIPRACATIVATVPLRLRDAMGIKEVPKTLTDKIQKFQLRDRAKAAPKIA
jgi:hypothetical protein